LVTEAVSQTRSLPPLPIRRTCADAYRCIWQYRWTFFWQLFIWALFMWVAQIPAQLLTLLARYAGLSWTMTGQDITDFAIGLTVSILCLLAGGGLMFLSCGRAIMFGRRPRIGDAVRPFRMGSFWRYLMLYWLIVNLVPTVAVQGLRTYFAFEGIGTWWLNYYGLLAAYWAWAVAAAPTIVLALPIAAFEPHARPMRDGWTRLRGNRLRLIALSVIAALPIVAAELILEYGATWFIDLLSAANWLLFGQYILNQLLTGLLRGMLSFLLILVMGTTVLSAYGRLSPRFEHVAQVFD
jgi:hypothetical protein